MTSQGRAYARFRRALDGRNTTGALSAAAELPHIGLADALELCLLLRDLDQPRYGRAASRWLARYLLGNPAIAIGDAAAVAALLAALEGQRGRLAARALAEFLERREQLPAAEVLIRWASE